MTQNHYYMEENFWLQLQSSQVASPKISKNKHFVNAVLISPPWPIAWANKASWMKCEPNLETSPFFKTQGWPFIKDLSNVSSNQLGRPTKQTTQTKSFCWLKLFTIDWETKSDTQELGHSTQFKGKGCHFPTYYFF